MKQFIIFLLAAFSLLFASQCVAQTPKNGNVTNKKKKDGNIYPDTIFPNHAKFTRELPQGGSNDANVVIDSQGNLKKGGVGTDLKKYWAKVGDTINSNINPSVGISGWVDTAANSSNPALMIYGGRNSKSGKSSVFITEPNTNTMYLSNSSSVPDEEVIVDMSSKKDLFLLTRKGAIRFTPLNTKPTGFATDGAFVYDNIGGAVYIAKNGQYRRLMDTTDFNKNDFWRKSGDTINNQTGYQEYNAVVVDTSNNENNNSFANFGSQAPKLGKYAMAYFNAKTNSINIVNTNPNWQSDFSLGEDVIGFGTKRGAFRLFPTNTPPMGVLPANFGDLAYDNTGGKLYVIKANAQGIPEWRRLVDTTELANENNLKNEQKEAFFE